MKDFLVKNSRYLLIGIIILFLLLFSVIFSDEENLKTYLSFEVFVSFLLASVLLRIDITRRLEALKSHYHLFGIEDTDPFIDNSHFKFLDIIIVFSLLASICVTSFGLIDFIKNSNINVSLLLKVSFSIAVGTGSGFIFGEIGYDPFLELVNSQRIPDIRQQPTEHE